ncbi:MAG: type II toxin-antitoxin system prevent-host-death family antitoxin [Caulobacteraceae bacterium]|nr:type II toxin-antitoxin system prevent-host-death family antitoxin [Caulobacteraceae bacterium]
MRREVGAYEAKTRLPQLLREVAQGDRITITVRGRAVAELAPPEPTKQSAAEAVDAMKAFGLTPGVSAEEIANWIGDGRD